jgi:hypothetical protein
MFGTIQIGGCSRSNRGKAAMEKETIKALGKVLKRDLRVPEDLPYPIKKALEQLAKQPYEEGAIEPQPPLTAQATNR